MDPNAALRNVRDTIAAVCSEPQMDHAALRLADAVRDLDEWLAEGGFPPGAWHEPGWQAAAERGLRGWSAAVHRLGELIEGAATEHDREVLRAAYGRMVAEGYPGDRKCAHPRGYRTTREDGTSACACGQQFKTDGITPIAPVEVRAER